MTTKYGQKNKYNVRVETGRFAQQEASAFEGGWNSSWQLNAQVEIDENQLKQNGNYLNISAPPDAKGAGWKQLQDDIKEIKGSLDLIKSFLMGKTTSMANNDTVGDITPPPVKDEINVDDIPF